MHSVNQQNHDDKKVWRLAEHHAGPGADWDKVREEYQRQLILFRRDKEKKRKARMYDRLQVER